MSLSVSALVGSTWPSPAKALIAFLMCVIGAFVPIAVSGVELTNLILVLPLLWLGTQAFYRLWFKPTGIAPWIETLFFNTKTDGPVQPVQVRRFNGPYDRPVIDDYDDNFHP